MTKIYSTMIMLNNLTFINNISHIWMYIYNRTTKSASTTASKKHGKKSKAITECACGVSVWHIDSF